MKCNRLCFLSWLIDLGEHEFVEFVIPDMDDPFRAGDYELLSQTDVHTCDLLLVEIRVNIPAQSRDIMSAIILQLDINL